MVHFTLTFATREGCPDRVRLAGTRREGRETGKQRDLLSHLLSEERVRKEEKGTWLGFVLTHSFFISRHYKLGKTYNRK